MGFPPALKIKKPKDADSVAAALCPIVATSTKASTIARTLELQHASSSQCLSRVWTESEFSTSREHHYESIATRVQVSPYFEINRI
jgi:hypothetical protein